MSLKYRLSGSKVRVLKFVFLSFYLSMPLVYTCLKILRILRSEVLIQIEMTGQYPITTRFGLTLFLQILKILVLDYLFSLSSNFKLILVVVIGKKKLQELIQ